MVVAIVCAMYAYLFFTGGGVKPDGTTIIGITPYLGFMNVTFVVICLTVVGVTYGKLSAKLAAYMFLTLSLSRRNSPGFWKNGGPRCQWRLFRQYRLRLHLSAPLRTDHLSHPRHQRLQTGGRPDRSLPHLRDGR